MHDQGHAARNVFRRVPLLLHFGAYAQTQGAKTWTDLPPHVPGFVDDWLREHDGDGRTEQAKKRVVNTVRGPTEQMLRLLLPDFAGTGRGHPFPFASQAPGFVAHLREERGLRPATLLIYRHCLRYLEVYLLGLKANSL